MSRKTHNLIHCFAGSDLRRSFCQHVLDQGANLVILLIDQREEESLNVNPDALKQWVTCLEPLIKAK